MNNQGLLFFSFLIFALLIISEFRYFASSSSLLGEKYEEFSFSDSDSVSVLHFRKLLGGLMGLSSSSLLKTKSCEIHMFSPLRRLQTVVCKLIAVMFLSVMPTFKHTMFSKFRYVGVEFISILHRNVSPIFSRILPRFSIFRENNFSVNYRIFIVLSTPHEEGFEFSIQYRH